jgi:hypothetical protein
MKQHESGAAVLLWQERGELLGQLAAESGGVEGLDMKGIWERRVLVKREGKCMLMVVLFGILDVEDDLQL